MFIKNQTPEVCLAAVKNFGYSIQFVQEQTKEICLEAIKNKGKVIEDVAKGILNNNEHFIFKNPNIRKVYVNKIDGKWLFSVGCQNNITKDEFIEIIHTDNEGLEKNPHRQIYLDFLKNF